MIQTLSSSARFVAPIAFPQFAGRQHYMATTEGRAVDLPPHIAAYNNQVQALCDELGYGGTIHVTVDEKQVVAGQTQRKPGIHVDGHFLPDRNIWGHGGGGGWNHFCNEVPMPRMAIAVASDVARCRVFDGVFHGTPGEQGDLSHIADQVGEGRIVPANEWHLLTPDCVHESLPVEADTQRSFIRVAFAETVQ